MARKNNDNNPLGIKVKAFSIPKSITAPNFFAKLVLACDQRLNLGQAEELPEQWDVRLWWVNPKSKGITSQWRWDDFVAAINESREGFVAIVKGIVGRALSREKAKAELRRLKNLKQFRKKGVKKKHG